MTRSSLRVALFSCLVLCFAGTAFAQASATASNFHLDTNTRGAWQGTYGGDGYSLAGVASSSVPTYASFSLQNQTSWTWAPSTTDPRALEVPGSPTSIAATWFNPTSFTIDVSVGPSAHQFALYAVDWDNQGRAQTFQVEDAATGTVLDTESINNFTNGVYLVWTLTGHVKIIVTETAAVADRTEAPHFVLASARATGSFGRFRAARFALPPSEASNPNAVVSGAFFGGAPAPAAATFVHKDLTTGGSWQGTYGSDGSSLATVMPAAVPSYASLSLQNQLSYTWAPSTTDSRALQLPGSSSARIAATWYSSTTPFTLDVNMGTSSHQLALYAVDWDNQGRSESFQVQDAITGNLLDSETIANFSNGVYLVWNISGHVQITVTRMNGSNAVVSGAFFGGGGINATSGTPQTTTISTVFAEPLVVTVTAPGGNPVANATVTFTAPPSGASGTFAGGVNTATTNSSGVAKSAAFTANGIAGAYTITATASGVSGIASFSLANANPPAAIVPTSGTPQSAPVKTTFGAPLVVTVTDAGGNPVPNATVTFNPPATGASGTFGGANTAITNSSGEATSPVFRANGTTGNYTVAANVPGVAQTANFLLTNSVGASVQFLKKDTTTQGNWEGVYGADGYALATMTPNLPSYATFAPHLQLNFVWASNTTDPRALQIPGSSTRIAPAWYDTPGFSLDVNVGNSPRQFALYGVDWDNIGRAELIQVEDAVTGNLLDSETISNFSGGVYLVWNLTGHVKIIVTLTAGDNACMSAAFFGGGNATPSPALSITKTHAGNFAQGQQNAEYTVTVSNAPGALPTTGTVTVTDTLPSGLSLVSMSGSGWTCPANSNACTRADALAAASSYPPISVLVDVAPSASSPQVNQVSVSGGGSSSASFSDSTIIGTVNAGGASAQFIKQDAATQGNWHGAYGADGYWVAQDSQALPSYASVAIQNQLNWIWSSSTSDVRALQNGADTGRLAATWYNPGSFSLDVNVTGGVSHAVALYAIDWDSQGRSETIQITDAGTSAQLDSRTITNFTGGVYLVWNISGHVTITVTVNGGPNGVISGIFFDAAQPVAAAPAAFPPGNLLWASRMAPGVGAAGAAALLLPARFFALTEQSGPAFAEAPAAAAGRAK